MELMKLTERVCETARRASAIMMNPPHEIVQKGNRSDYVTDADLLVQRTVSEELTRLLPESAVLGEESAALPQMRDYIWIVDPIDGTSNYIRDIGESCISIALAHQEELILGVVYQPWRNEMFYAAKDCGAFLNGKPIHVSDRDFAHAHLCAALCLYDKRFAKPCMNIISEVYRQADDFRRFGVASYEAALVGAGRTELHFEIKICPWDVAAGAVIIEEAGGVWECLYSDHLPLDRKFPFLAANSPENLARLREIVVQEIPEIPYDGRLFPEENHTK